ncbi:MAG: MiaB/RimO family radical SAM methylthiotransferase [Moorellaceae bacterium]
MVTLPFLLFFPSLLVWLAGTFSLAATSTKEVRKIIIFQEGRSLVQGRRTVHAFGGRVIKELPLIHALVATFPREEGKLHALSQEPEVELVEEARRTGKIINAVRELEEGEPFEELPVSQVHRARAFIKIQEGCEEYCTYCIVPYARGPLRSRAPELVVEEARKLVAAGYKEIVLTGVHTGAYGRDAQQGIDLSDLLRRLLKLPGLGRIRVSSIDPLDFTPELIRTLTEEEKICPHFHIPLQSGDDFILQRMGRRYTSREYLHLLHLLRSGRPRVAITTDIIVGFPGEKEEHFRHTLEVAQEAAFARIHVFPYSPRAGTPAAAMTEQVEPEVKKERVARLRSLAKRLEEEYARSFLGEVMEVLAEEMINKKEGLWEGHTGNYLTVVFAAAGDWTGRLLPVRLLEWRTGKVWGEKIF